MDNYWDDVKVAQFAKAYTKALEAKKNFLRERKSDDVNVRENARDTMLHAIHDYRMATTIRVRELLDSTLDINSLEGMCKF